MAQNIFEQARIQNRRLRAGLYLKLFVWGGPELISSSYVSEKISILDQTDTGKKKQKIFSIFVKEIPIRKTLILDEILY